MSDNHDLLNDNDMCSFSGHEAEDMCFNCVHFLYVLGVLGLSALIRQAVPASCCCQFLPDESYFLIILVP